MDFKGPNHQFIIWSSWILWLISLLSILCSLVLFFCVSDILFLTGTDLVNAVDLLSGIVMLPTNVFIVYLIAKGRTIDHTAKLFCCRLWMCIMWIIIINIVGVILCIHRICVCEDITMNNLQISMKQYRTVPQRKHFMDNLQWGLRCCGVNSYRDWFTYDWHDRIRDFDWSPVSERSAKQHVKEIDSVPLSCCKSGTCVSNYLKELGTYSINTNGCSFSMFRIIRISMNVHLIIFVLVIVLEGFLLKHIMIGNKSEVSQTREAKRLNVNNIMTVNDNFEISSGSYQMYGDESDEMDTSMHSKNIEKK